MLTKYKNIIWDWNGTLLDDVSLCIEIINELLVANSLFEISYEKYREIFQFPISKYYEQLGFDLSNNQFELLASDYVKQYNARVEECPLHTGVEETLDRLNILGKKQFILSANEHLSLQEAVEQKRIDVYFDKIQGLEGVKAESKLANGFDLMKKFEGEAILIGDTLHDVEVASELGIDCAVITCGHNSPDRFDDNNVLKFQSLHQLLVASSND